VLLVGDAAGLVSPLTGGGIKLAFELGRRAAQVISDYLQDRGPEPARVLAAEYPTYAKKRILRRLMNIAPPNWTWDLILNTPMMGWAAQQVYFHRRGAKGAGLEAEPPRSPATGYPSPLGKSL
jgi:flavin-dependent dehydrogenase